MNKRTILKLAAAIALVALIVGTCFVDSSLKARRYARQIFIGNIGAWLVQTTNSTDLVGLTPELQADLRVLLASPTERWVCLGDEPPPVGDGRASARLVLTNQMGRVLTLRLREEPAGSLKYRVLSYWKTEPQGGANGRQPFSSDTNRTSAAAASRRSP
jgi:hypothetical protein